MGHATETIFVETDQVQSTDWDSIVRAALNIWTYSGEEYGDARTGRIVAPSTMTKNAAYSWLNNNSAKVYDGQTVIIPVVRDQDTITRKAKKTLTVDEKTLRQIAEQHYEFRDALTPKVAALFSESLINFKVTKTPKLRKAAAVATEGKVTTTYSVMTGAARFNRRDILASGIPTQAEARAKAVELLNSPDGHRYGELVVEASVSRDSGDKALVRVTREFPETGTIEVEAKLEKAKPSAKVAGWVVAFDYHF